MQPYIFTAPSSTNMSTFNHLCLYRVSPFTPIYENSDPENALEVDPTDIISQHIHQCTIYLDGDKPMVSPNNMKFDIDASA